MKLIQAMSRIKQAISENSLTYSILPPACFPFSYLPCNQASEYFRKNRVAGVLSNLTLEKVFSVVSKDAGSVCSLKTRNVLKRPVLGQFRWFPLPFKTSFHKPRSNTN